MQERRLLGLELLYAFRPHFVPVLGLGEGVEVDLQCGRQQGSSVRGSSMSSSSSKYCPQELMERVTCGKTSS